MAQNLGRRKAKKVAKPPKKLEDYVQTRPEQLDLFELLAPAERAYSNTVELYDFIPKYVWGKQERVDGKFLDQLKREFECRGVNYQVRMSPAKIEGNDGQARDHFPGKREELVEDALRNLATNGQALFLDDEASVTFTLYQLQEELKKNGHSYSKDELKEALMICAQTTIDLRTADGMAVFVSSMFESLGLKTNKSTERNQVKTRAFVRFNSLVTNSIKSGTFRRLNYERSMGFKSVMARQLHKRMSHHYTQASITKPYTILLTTMIRDFGLAKMKFLSQDLQKTLPAFDELTQHEVILDFKLEKTFDNTKRGGLVEAKFIIIPHPKFVGEIVTANQKQADVKTGLLLKH